MKSTRVVAKPTSRSAAALAAGALVIQLIALQPSRAASTAFISANATTSVIASITIAKVSDLVFNPGSQNDAAAVVPAGAVDNPNNASFAVTGQASTAYTITLPTTVTMITGTGAAANQQIVVNAFTSFPSATGTLSAGGTQTLLVGATRAALVATQVSGAYTAPFTVTVNY